MVEAVRKNVMWRAIPIAGVAGGVAHLIVSSLLSSLVLGIGPGMILRYAAALVLGPDSLTETNAVNLVIGAVVHFVISLVLTLVIAIVVHRWGLLVGLIGGGLLGLAFYGINLYAMTVLFPFFFAINSPMLLLSHIVFGVVAGGVYELLDQFDQPLVKE
jgi:hypothetical protein